MTNRSLKFHLNRCNTVCSLFSIKSIFIKGINKKYSKPCACLFDSNRRVYTIHTIRQQRRWKILHCKGDPETKYVIFSEDASSFYRPRVTAKEI